MLNGSATYKQDETNDSPAITGLTPVKSSGKTRQQRQRQRQRQYRIHPSSSSSRVFISALLVLMLAIQSNAGSWFENRLRRICGYPSAEAPSQPPIEATTVPVTNLGGSDEMQASSPPLLVVATNEGQVWTIDASDGRLLAGFSTGPPLLIIDDHYEEATTDNSGEAFPAIPQGLAQSQIVPSMDGILYWRQPLSSSSDQDSDNESDSSDNNHHDSSSSSKLVPIASIRDLVDNPIQICLEVEGENCDILTATSLGPSLFSLNSEGSLNWARARSDTKATSVKPVPIQRESSGSSGEDTDDDDDSSTDGSEGDDSDSDSTVNSSTSKTNLLLQRQDFLVQQISTETGEQVWNITWGNLEALDFMGESDGASNGARNRRSHQSFHFLPSGEPVSSELPSLIFANEGKSLVALWTQPPKFLWKRDFISVVTNVLGIERDAWQAVNVVAESNDVGDHGSKEDGKRPGHQILQPLLPSHEESQDEQDSFRYWWWAGGAKGLGKEQVFVQPQEENGLVFMPRPHAHNLVRNSWFLNHLWDSPQARGVQDFQGYLADTAHNKPTDQSKEQKNQAVMPPKRKQPTSYYPQSQIENFYDMGNMPRLLLLPSAEHPLPSPATSGGLFLSWSVVVAIMTFLIGTAGAAYILYGQKKRKWMAANSPENSANGVNDRTGSDLTSESMALVTRSRSQSVSVAERSHSRSRESLLNGSYPDFGPAATLSNHKPPRILLNRSCSAPMMSNDSDDAPFFSDLFKPSLASQSIHNRDIRSSLPTGEAVHEIVNVEKGQLTKHQSAPVGATLAPQGVGMIDGIPLIRYSRYQSEFREIEPLGRGGFGSVFRVANVLDGREYAVKKVSIRSSDWNSPGTEAFSQELHRVLREVKFLALLDHPNIVRYYTAWLEMEANEALPGGEDTTTNADTNTRTLSRRFSSELLTGLDQTNCESQTTASFLANKMSAASSKATLSHLRPKKDANPLGWNTAFGDFEESSIRPKHAALLPPSTEDCGFIFEERSDQGENAEDPSHVGTYMHPYREHSATSSECSKSEHSHSVSSSWDASYSLNRRKKKAVSSDNVQAEEKEGEAETGDRQRDGRTSRHTLYIQMQLCSPETLSDFLSNKEARQGPGHLPSSSSTTVDIPLALRLFLQIVQAVNHVHRQNLIHRDLKPSNCFIDETGTVKVGDFGLSRESTDSNDGSVNSSLILEGQQDIQGNGDNTVGVGTRSYASPEQMSGSDYDATTDIYALGVMLFELLFPMYTGMERHICFQKLRTDGAFPEGWRSTISKPFPSLDELVRSMLSLKPKERPCAETVARHIQGLIEEHSVTLNISRNDADNEKIIFVRVEAKPLPDVLKVAIDLIHEAAAPETVEIVQYGMRSGTNNANAPDEKPQKRAILEFALAFPNSDPGGLRSGGSALVSKLLEHDEVLVARHVWPHGTLSNWGGGNRSTR